MAAIVRAGKSKPLARLSYLSDSKLARAPYLSDSRFAKAPYLSDSRFAKAPYLSDSRLARAPSVSYLSDSRLAKAPYLSDWRLARAPWASYLSDLRLARAPLVRYLSDSRLSKAPSVSYLSDSRLAIGLRLAKAALVSWLLVSALTIAAIWMAIEKGFDVQSGLEKFHLPRPDRPFFNNPIQDHESDKTACFGDKKNRTAELAASNGGSLALALLINKSLFALRLPFAAALIYPVAELLARWSTINKSKAPAPIALLSITIHVELLLVAFWITGSYEYAKKPVTVSKVKYEVVQDLKEESASGGGAISLEIIARQVLTKGGIFEHPANEPKNAMNNWKVDPKGAGKMLYPPFKPHALDEIYGRLGISYIDMVKKLLGGMESGAVGRKGCSVAAPSGMPFDPLREALFVTGRTSESVAAPLKVTTTLK